MSESFRLNKSEVIKFMEYINNCKTNEISDEKKTTLDRYLFYLIDSKQFKKINKMFKNPYLKSIILSDEIIVKKLILSKFSFGIVIYDEQFIDTIISIKDPEEYRFLINSLEYRHPMDAIKKIEAHRKNYYDKLLLSYNGSTKMFYQYQKIYDFLIHKLNTNNDLYEFTLTKSFNELPKPLQNKILLSFYNLKIDFDTKIEKLKKLFVEISADLYIKIIIDIHFKDVATNFFKNVENIIYFNKKHNCINHNNYLFYVKLLKCYKNSHINLELFNKLKDEYVTNFYDDYRKCKDYSYTLLNESLFSFENMKTSAKLSKKYDYPIYSFDGQPFFMIIHNTGIIKDEDINNYDLENIFSEVNFESTSSSLISNKRLKYYRDFLDSVVLGFTNVKINNIVHVYNSDSYSTFMECDEENLATQKVNKICDPKDLVRNTNGYNEIIFRNTQVCPDYILCFDEKIYKIDLEIARKFNIPIVNIEKKKYKDKYKKTVIKINSIDDSYIDSFEELQKVKKKSLKNNNF